MTSRIVQDDTLTVVNDAGEAIFSIEEQFEEPKALLRIAGKVTMESAHEFEDELTSLLTVCNNIVIDFTGTDYISSDGLQSLLNVQKAIDARPGAALALRGVEGNLLHQFKDTGFVDLFDIEG